MPRKYEEIRDSLVAKGMSLAEAKTYAAKIYNARRKKGTPPVTNKPDAPKK